MPLNQDDHGDRSWWTLSKDWPEYRGPFARKMYEWAIKNLPYGSYVIYDPAIRFESDTLMNRVLEEFMLVAKVKRVYVHISHKD